MRGRSFMVIIHAHVHLLAHKHTWQFKVLLGSWQTQPNISPSCISQIKQPLTFVNHLVHGV